MTAHARSEMTQTSEDKSRFEEATSAEDTSSRTSSPWRIKRLTNTSTLL